MANLSIYLLAAPAILLSLTVHEYFHAWTANKLGDPTAKNMGRLTLNPLAHLDFMGTLMLFVTQFRFGWAKPVPVNPYNLRNWRRDDLWISAAGPLSNLALALIAGTIYRVLGMSNMLNIHEGFITFLYLMILINVSLAFFNLIPIFPLDGSHILRSLLPERFGPSLDNFNRYAPMVLLGILMLGWFTGVSIIWIVLGPFVRTVMFLFSGIG